MSDIIPWLLSDIETSYAPTTPTAVCMRAHEIVERCVYRHNFYDVMHKLDFSNELYFKFLEHTPPHLRYVLLDSVSKAPYEVIDRICSEHRFLTYMCRNNQVLHPVFAPAHDIMYWKNAAIKAGINPYIFSNPRCDSFCAMDQWTPAHHGCIPHRVHDMVFTFLCCVRSICQTVVHDLRKRLVRTIVHAELLYMQHFDQESVFKTADLKEHAAELLGIEYVQDRKRASHGAVRTRLQYAHLVADAKFQRTFFDNTPIGDAVVESSLRRAWVAEDSRALCDLLDIARPDVSLFKMTVAWSSSLEIDARITDVLTKVAEASTDALHKLVIECEDIIGLNHLADAAMEIVARGKSQQTLYSFAQVIVRICKTRSHWGKLRLKHHDNGVFTPFPELHAQAVGQGMNWCCYSAQWARAWVSWTPQNHANRLLYTYGFRARANAVLMCRSWQCENVRLRIVRWLAVAYYYANYMYEGPPMKTITDRNMLSRLQKITKHEMIADLRNRGHFLKSTTLLAQVRREWEANEAEWKLWRRRLF